MFQTVSNSNKKAKLTSELEEFDSIFPQLVDELTKSGKSEPEVHRALDYFKKVIIKLQKEII